MVAKTVYDTNWKPSPITGLVFLVATAAVMYVPYYLKVPVFITPWVAVLCEFAFCIVVTLFFYSGISRAKQFRVTMITCVGVAVFGIISNLFYQSTFLVSEKLLTTDYVIAALMNLGAVALTMSCYRISNKKVEVSAVQEANAIHPEQLKKLTPLVASLPIIAAVTLMAFSQNLPNGDVFAISLPFFISAQLVLSFWSAFFFFKDKTRAEKIYLGLCILSIALALGAIGNHLHHVTSMRPGLRIMLSSNEFLIMNAGAAIIVLVFMHWKKNISEQLTKRTKLLEQQPSPAPAIAETVPTPPDTAVVPPLTSSEPAQTTTTPEVLKTEQPQDTKAG